MTEIEPDKITEVVTLAQGAISAITKSETEAQLDAAHKYKRSVRDWVDDAMSIATINEEVAGTCIYSVPRDGKAITGPTVRLAEICASAYGNLHVGARVVGIEDKEIVAQGIAWDLEKNLRATVEVRRRIVDKKGRRYSDDMITVTGNAAASIALRNAIFRVIPRAYVDTVFERAREVAVGNASTLSQRRTLVVERLGKMGVLPQRLLKRIERASVEDITLNDLETLIGLGTAIKNGDTTVDQAFPAELEPTKGTLDLSALRPGVEPNRGHDDTNLAAVKPEPCTTSDFDHLEILGTECKVPPKRWRQHIEKTMGFAAWDLLTKDRLVEVFKWIDANRKAETR